MTKEMEDIFDWLESTDKEWYEFLQTEGAVDRVKQSIEELTKRD